MKNLIAFVTIIRLLVKNGGPAKWLTKLRVENQEQDSLILALRQDQEDMKYSLSLANQREEGWQNRFRYLQYCYELEKLTTRIAKIRKLPSIEKTHKQLSQMLKDMNQQIPLRSYQRVVIDGLMKELNTLVDIAERPDGYAYCHQHKEWYDTQHWSCCEKCWKEKG